MPCAGDSELPLEVISRRTADLAAAAEMAAADHNFTPRYSIGSEVPPLEGRKLGKNILSSQNSLNAAETYLRPDPPGVFCAGIGVCLERVIALVVQPGVDFGDETIHDYHRPAAADLARFIETVPGLSMKRTPPITKLGRRCETWWKLILPSSK